MLPYYIYFNKVSLNPQSQKLNNSKSKHSVSRRGLLSNLEQQQPVELCLCVYGISKFVHKLKYYKQR